VSPETGRPEVYVRPFPNVDLTRFVISVSGGAEPLWRGDGGELYFRSLHGDVNVVDVTATSDFRHGPPRQLFPASGFARDAYYRSYDVVPDGSRFLMISRGDESGTDLSVVFNWRAELERLLGGAP